MEKIKKTFGVILTISIIVTFFHFIIMVPLRPQGQIRDLLVTFEIMIIIYSIPFITFSTIERMKIFPGVGFYYWLHHWKKISIKDCFGLTDYLHDEYFWKLNYINPILEEEIRKISWWTLLHRKVVAIKILYDFVEFRCPYFISNIRGITNKTNLTFVELNEEVPAGWIKMYPEAERFQTAWKSRDAICFQVLLTLLIFKDELLSKKKILIKVLHEENIYYEMYEATE